MSNPKYGPHPKMYSANINDMVENEIEKGGPGSGKKGHKTAKDSNQHKGVPQVHEIKPGMKFKHEGRVFTVKTAPDKNGMIWTEADDGMKFFNPAYPYRNKIGRFKE